MFQVAILNVRKFVLAQYEIVPTTNVEVVQESDLRPMTTSFMPTQSTNTVMNIASMNTLNLDPMDGDKKFEDFAQIIVRNLRSPDVITSQEVQDENGAEKSRTIPAGLTSQMLVTAIELEPSCS